MHLVFDYVCPSCGTEVLNKFVAKDEKDSVECPSCGEKHMTRLPPIPRVDWDRLAMGDSASPEAISHFEKKRLKQREREKKAKDEHGDYGPRPGS
jgi:putative FmdB family regulatory protein